MTDAGGTTMKHAQEVEGWALDEGNRITQTMSLNEATYVTVAKGLQRQHTRSVRIVKRLMKGYINKNFNGQFYDRIDTCEYILHLLQRGRGGKG